MRYFSFRRVAVAIAIFAFAYFRFSFAERSKRVRARRPWKCKAQRLLSPACRSITDAPPAPEWVSYASRLTALIGTVPVIQLVVASRYLPRPEGLSRWTHCRTHPRRQREEGYAFKRHNRRRQ